jgi:hypothetical protein
MTLRKPGEKQKKESPQPRPPLESLRSELPPLNTLCDDPPALKEPPEETPRRPQEDPKKTTRTVAHRSPHTEQALKRFDIPLAEKEKLRDKRFQGCNRTTFWFMALFDRSRFNCFPSSRRTQTPLQVFPASLASPERDEELQEHPEKLRT